MRVPRRNAGWETVAIQAKTVIQPWKSPQNAGDPSLGGANMAVHRYWAPTVGFLDHVSKLCVVAIYETYMDAISAIEAARASEPMTAMIVPYINDVGPPLRRPA